MHVGQALGIHRCVDRGRVEEVNPIPYCECQIYFSLTDPVFNSPRCDCSLVSGECLIVQG